jgi:hypothetical protein
VDQVRLQAEFVEQLGQPAPAIGGLEGDRGARRQTTQDGDQLGGVVSQVAVGELDAMLVHQRHLGALAVDIHTDVHTHQGLLP